MAVLNFDRAHDFSITGGIYSEAKHVTMISSSGTGRRYRRSGKSSRRSKRGRTPSPSTSSEASFVTSDDSFRSVRSSPPTSVDEHEVYSSQSVLDVPQARPDLLSPLSSRLGAIPGFATPTHTQTPVASHPTELPRSPDIARPATIHQPTDTLTPTRFHRQLGRDADVRLRPQGPRRRPLPQTPPSSQFVHHGTPAALLSPTSSLSHSLGSSSQSSWNSYIVPDPPHSFMRSPSTVPSRSSTSPLQPVPLPHRSGPADVFVPSPSYANNYNYPSRPASSQVLLSSPLRDLYTESVTSPSRRSVQSPPPNHPFRSIPLPSASAPSRTSTASRSHGIHSSTSTRTSHRAFRPSPTERPFLSPVRPTNTFEMNAQPLLSYQYHLPAQNLSDMDFTYTSSSGIPQQHSQYSAAGPAYLPQPPYQSHLRSQHPFHGHIRGSYDGPSMSSQPY